MDIGFRNPHDVGQRARESRPYDQGMWLVVSWMMMARPDSGSIAQVLDAPTHRAVTLGEGRAAWCPIGDPTAGLFLHRRSVDPLLAAALVARPTARPTLPGSGPDSGAAPHRPRVCPRATTTQPDHEGATDFSCEDHDSCAPAPDLQRLQWAIGGRASGSRCCPFSVHCPLYIDPMRISVIMGGHRGRGVPIAVVDTTIPFAERAAADLPSFRPYTCARPRPECRGVRTWDFANDVGLGAEPLCRGARASHGEAVASILAAPDDGAGLRGVAPDSPLFSLGMGSAPDVFGMACAITHAVELGARVINVSASVGDGEVLRRTGRGTDEGRTEPLRLALDYAARRGVAIVVAMNNSATADPDYGGYPAREAESFANVFAVGASAEDRVLTSDSSRAPYMTGAAPGVNVLARMSAGYVCRAGTSYAAPLVSGALALLTEIQEARRKATWKAADRGRALDVWHAMKTSVRTEPDKDDLYCEPSCPEPLAGQWARLFDLEQAVGRLESQDR